MQDAVQKTENKNPAQEMNNMPGGDGTGPQGQGR